MRTAIYHGKFRRRGRAEGHRRDWKKAYVKLAPEREDDRVRGESVTSSDSQACTQKQGALRDVPREGSQMALKSFNPYTASRRFITMLDKSEVTKQTPEKSLVEPKKRTGGRNSHGEMTMLASRRRPQEAVPRRSISAARRRAFRRAWRPSSTIPTARRAWRCCIMPTARSATSCIPSGSKWA